MAREALVSALSLRYFGRASLLFRTRGRSATVTFIAAAAVLAAVASGASCASQGQGTNETFSDGSADGTQEASGSSSGASGGSSGSGSGSSSGGGAACDADTMSDPFNCGSCGNHCPQGDICSCGTCMAPCPAGKATCCGTCADLMTDPNNCGMCNLACPTPSTTDLPTIPLCMGGQCTFTCQFDAGVDAGSVIACGTDSGAAGCFNPVSSANACGGCGHQCPSGNDCIDTTCCASGDILCGGQCKNASSDPNNCGACDAGCPAPGVCSGGKCTGYAPPVVNPSGVTFIDACTLTGHQSVLPRQSGWATSGALLSLPFTFTFYGAAETQFWIGTQGVVGLGAPMTFPGPTGYPDCQNGDPSNAYAGLVPFGEANLGTGANGICYGDTGATPNDQFVVTWSQATEGLETGSVLTFSVILTKNTNTIDFVYQTAADSADGGLDPTVEGSQATVGIQYPPTATNNVKFSCYTPFITATPFAVRFTPL